MPSMSRVHSVDAPAGPGDRSAWRKVSVSMAPPSGRCFAMSGGELVAGLVDGGGDLGVVEWSPRGDRHVAGGHVDVHPGDRLEDTELAGDGSGAVVAGHADHAVGAGGAHVIHLLHTP